MSTQVQDQPDETGAHRSRPKRHTKVVRFRILKPAGEMSWKKLSQRLRDVRYRVFRLANLAVSENYVNYHMWRIGKAAEFERATIGQLSRRLRGMLEQERRDKGKSEAEIAAELDWVSKDQGLATPANIHDALSKYKLKAITAPSKWRDVVRGKVSLPTFRLDMAIPIRCDGSHGQRLESTESGDVELDLVICRKPYPRVVLQTGAIGDGVRAILDRLLDNKDQAESGYRQRVYEIKHNDRDNKWWLYVTYDFPATESPTVNKEIIVGVDVGVSCPLYAAISNGYARLGWRQFQALGARIRSLQRQIMARRRSMQTGGKVAVSQKTARSGHGRKRKLRPIEKLEGRIDSAYQTLNHQLSAAVVDFARNHGAGVIQIEDLDGLRDALRGTFIGQRWRYHQLQQYLKYKADEAGIELRQVNPRFTSRRCSKCGHIRHEFDHEYRQTHRNGRFAARFECLQCGYKAHADYNAARNLATLDIARLIARQCKVQGLPVKDEDL
jgi:IS605 OrfB family transposase